MGVLGERDRILGAEQMTRSATFVESSWRFEWVDAGHWLQVEAADRVNELLLDFLSEPSD